MLKITEVRLKLSEGFRLPKSSQLLEGLQILSEILRSLLLTSNHTICQCLVQFGINKRLQIALALRACAILLVFEKTNSP